MPSQTGKSPVAVKQHGTNTDSRGTSVFSPSDRPARSNAPSTSSSSSQGDLTRVSSLHSTPLRDPCIPPEWSFESSYGLFGGMASTMSPSNIKPAKEPHKDATSKGQTRSVLGSSFFGRKKEKVKVKANANQAGEGEKSGGRSLDLERSESPQTPPQITSDVAFTIAVTNPSMEEEIPSPEPQPTPLPEPPARPPRSPRRPQTPVNGSSDGKEPNPASAGENGIATGSAKLRRHHRTLLTTPLAPIPASVTPSRAPSPNSEAQDTITPIESRGFNFTTHRALSNDEKVQSAPPIKATTTPGKRGPRRPMTAPGSGETRKPNAYSIISGGTWTSLNTHTLGGSVTVTEPASMQMVMQTSSTSLESSSSAASEQKGESPAEAFRRRLKEARERGFKMKNKRRHHPRPKQEAPYPRDFENPILDHDRWSNSFGASLARNVTFHSFESPPVRVLDLGCGTGDWILDCARKWKDSTFVGFDLVPVQPQLRFLDDDGLASRVKWVIGNFLEPLPFEDDEFDFVHMRQIARGVPEDRWHPFFEEVTRILKDGGSFEMIEEDLFFPGSETVISEKPIIEEKPTTEEIKKKKADARTSLLTLASSEPETPKNRDEDKIDPVGAQTPERRLSDPAAQTPTPRDLWSTFETNGGGVETINKNEPISMRNGEYYQGMRPRMSLDAWHTRGLLQNHIRPNRIDPTHHEDIEDDNEPELFHIPSGALTNPRDHSILQMAYNELHAARFINLTPLSILHSALTLHFRDIQTHQPMEMMFPPSIKDQQALSKAKVSIDSTRSDGAASQTSDGSIPLLKLVPIGKAMARDPNSTVKKKIDLEPGLLRMHLAARVAEVLACAEDMWEFIEECKTSPLRWKNPDLEKLAEVSREEWEDCLSRFSMDMDDKIAMGQLIRDELAWTAIGSPRTNDRKAFDDAVEKWEAHLREEGSKSISPPQSTLMSRKFRVFIARK